MAKCVNCTEQAIYEYVITPTASQLYCVNHAPRGLKGNLNFRSYQEPVVVEAPKTTSKKKATAPVVEEVPAEATPTEE